MLDQLSLDAPASTSFHALHYVFSKRREGEDIDYRHIMLHHPPNPNVRQLAPFYDMLLYDRLTGSLPTPVMLTANFMERDWATYGDLGQEECKKAGSAAASRVDHSALVVAPLLAMVEAILASVMQ